ncbi:NEDD8-conjugating enzyme Ubc12 isoform X2 [Pipistrellus kuhlii]|uniref:NEDD8-conjugating enzyme Ubc12 isoform X2 n=1 Tax=Pipistrellus kuhlii TaxID=59472 RepID=UPI001E26ED3E|nr:NEDD8-conjugating enzyme Ubc12 isoform X2 [Pipistrellus kuhlii]
MIKLFSLKQQKKEEESAGGTKGSSKKASAAQLRIQKDINELNLPKTCDISFSDPDDLLNFKLVICPDEGFYKSGKFVFSFKVGQGYPHDPPKVKCETMVYHPNIDLEGNVCLNILSLIATLSVPWAWPVLAGPVAATHPPAPEPHALCPQRGLEASPYDKLHNLWPAVSLLGAQPRRPTQQGSC